jgi:UDP-N-acetyl-D-glucosamine dehydrogenase
VITCSSAADICSELKTRIDTRRARVGVIGLGYVRLPLALLHTGAKFRLLLDRAAGILGDGYA